MLEEMLLLFSDALRLNPDAFPKHTTIDKQSGRVEERTCYQTDNVGWFADKDKWAGLRKNRVRHEREAKSAHLKTED